MPGEAYNQIFELAATQHGFVTAVEATEIGVESMTLIRMAERGTLQRVSRGVYRLPAWPAGRFDDYMAATLWPLKTRGVLSHETALELWELSDVNPAQIHITVPKDYWVRRRKPPARYVLHHEDLAATGITKLEGMDIAVPAVAIRQAAKDHLGGDLIGQAISQAKERGLIRSRVAAELAEELGVGGRP
jgi:predicted transcriptional regulator of viral defense system